MRPVTPAVCAILSVAIFLMSFGGAAHADVLRYPFGAYNGPPFFLDPSAPTRDGISVQIVEEAARRLGHTVSFINMPRKRQEQAFAAGEVDVTCHTQPSWLDNPAAFHFAETYMTADVFVSRSLSAKQLKGHEPLAAEAVGTIHGFHYEGPFQRIFERGAIKVEAHSFSQLWNLLVAGRLDAFIATDLIAGHLIRIANKPAGISVIDIGATKSAKFCAVRRSHADASRFAATIIDMRQDGTIKAILARYVDPKLLN